MGTELVDVDVSVVVTSYNQRRYLGAAIDSVIDQTHRPSEIVVVDDASTDGSQGLIEQYTEEYPELVVPVLHDEERGIPQTRNSALEHVTGDVVTLLDGDDRFLPEKLERELEVLLENPDIRAVYSDTYYVDEDGERTGQWAGETTPPTGDVFCDVFERNWPDGSLFRDELVYVDDLKELGGYDEALPIYEDWDLKIRLTADRQVAYCPAPLSEYRLHPGGISHRTDVQKHRDVIATIVEKNRPLLGRLPTEERAAVERTLENTLLKYDALAAAADGDRLAAARYYLQYLGRKPGALLDYKLHVQFLLPDAVYRRIWRLYQRITRSSAA